MKAEAHKTIYLKDYREPAFWARKVDLNFDLHDGYTVVTSKVLYEKNKSQPDGELVLDGKELELEYIAVNGEELQKETYKSTANYLIIHKPMISFELEIRTRIYPEANTALEGLYHSGSKYCTQCEPEGFRRITFFPDRPDIMAGYTTRIEGDKSTCPVLLSNGNLIECGEVGEDRHFTTWQDPFPKPSYLFALVAGNLVSQETEFTTKSGRKVPIKIFVEEKDKHKCAFALDAVIDSMRWEEEVYGLEYDLDVFMIVAVSDFNMGAMENKGLNIFNSKYVLADQKTATDADFEAIRSVIGHEYFHNWTGNRVTCRDWFQLSLKEGLTVFRDQEFSADHGSRGVLRIQDVNALRNSQFVEDSGPMAHPVRPDSYIEINNFYTATVYNKGAEVIRMMRTIIGHEAFHRGVDIFLKQHDGSAATVEHFIEAMEEASQMNFDQFKRWYFQAGTPNLQVSEQYLSAKKQLRISFKQQIPKTPGQEHKKPHIIPVKTSLFNPQGKAIIFEYQGQKSTEHTLIVSEREQDITLHNIEQKPIASYLRDFSAPIKLIRDISHEELRFLIQYDDNDFNRYEATQNLLITITEAFVEKDASLQQEDIASIRALLIDKIADKQLIAAALSLPTTEYLTNQLKTHTIDELFYARRRLEKALGLELEHELFETFQHLQETAELSSQEGVAARALKAMCLKYLTATENIKYIELAQNAFAKANSMTETMGAIGALSDLKHEIRDQAMKQFYEQWQDDELVLDKWFTLQASSNHPDVMEHVKQLCVHPKFNLLKPNRVYSLLRRFAKCNPEGFHALSGEGYRLMADHVMKIDPKNPSVASILAKTLSQWQSFDSKRQALMKGQLNRILACPELSKDTYEIVEKSLKL